MNRHRIRTVIPSAFSLLAFVALPACGARPIQNSHTQDNAVVDVQRAIIIRRGVTFVPPSATSKPRLTAQQAYADFMHHLGAPRADLRISANVAVELGLFTLPIGLGADGKEMYTAHAELAYGYSWHSCPTSLNPRVRTLPH